MNVITLLAKTNCVDIDITNLVFMRLLQYPYFSTIYVVKTSHKPSQRVLENDNIGVIKKSDRKNLLFLFISRKCWLSKEEEDEAQSVL